MKSALGVSIFAFRAALALGALEQFFRELCRFLEASRRRCRNSSGFSPYKSKVSHRVQKTSQGNTWYHKCSSEVLFVVFTCSSCRGAGGQSRRPELLGASVSVPGRRGIRLPVPHRWRHQQWRWAATILFRYDRFFNIVNYFIFLEFSSK